MFQLLSSQVRAGGLGGFIGFDYSALYSIFLSKQVPLSEWLFILDKIHLLTTIASEKLNKKDGG